MSTAEDTTVTTDSDRMVGQVKWFNNKAGYGFITVSDGEYSGKDIFIHFSAIRVTNSQYKYLVQGEYVEFALIRSNNSEHEYQATDISGIKNGALMCETRQVVRQQQPADKERRPRRYKVSSEEGPRQTPDDAGEFTTVRRRQPRPQQRRRESTVAVSQEM